MLFANFVASLRNRFQNRRGTIRIRKAARHGWHGSFSTQAVEQRILLAAPVAIADEYSTAKDAPIAVAAADGLLGNDSDPDGDPLAAVLESGTSNGVLALAPNGGFSYTPNNGYSGTDTFTYHADDGMEQSESTTVSLKVIGIDASSSFGIHWEGSATSSTPYFGFWLTATSSHEPPVSCDIDVDNNGDFDYFAAYDSSLGGVLVHSSYLRLPNHGTESLDNGSYPVMLRVTLESGFSATSQISVNLGIFPPDINLTDNVPENGTISVGDDVLLTLDIIDLGVDTISSTVIQWGDGTSQSIAGDPNGTYAHAYSSDGTFSAKVIVTDEDGTWSRTHKIDIGNPSTPTPPPDLDPQIQVVSATETPSGVQLTVAGVDYTGAPVVQYE